MQIKSRGFLAFVALALFSFHGFSQGNPPPVTTITVPDMHCISCAKQMATHLYQVPGVATVQANVPATTLIVNPHPSRVLSPKALWEAVEKAGYRPSRLQGPNGIFSSKPIS